MEFLAILLLPFILYWLAEACPKCNKKQLFKTPKILDTKYTDTTPTKKDGSHDLRHKKSGYSSSLKKWNCKCGHTWERWV
jgi:hypothetical protein